MMNIYSTYGLVSLIIRSREGKEGEGIWKGGGKGKGEGDSSTYTLSELALLNGFQRLLIVNIFYEVRCNEVLPGSAPTIIKAIVRAKGGDVALD